MVGNFWPDYRSVWRWHFYAGLLCLPFVIILSLTGCVYLFRPQIEAWTERNYDGLNVQGKRQPASSQIAAALAAFPGSAFVSCELPKFADSALRVTVRAEGRSVRTFVHPGRLEVLGWIPEDDRVMRFFFRLHGELLMGDRGSNLVETVACWTIVLLLTGLFLWWPRNRHGMAGVLYPRLRSGRRLFWRDLHAVTGMWITGLALFLLLTGLPWAKFWGDYFRQVRQLTGTAAVRQDWANGSAAKSDNVPVQAAGGHAGHGSGAGTGGLDVSKLPPAEVLDAMVESVRRLELEPPVLLAAPGGRSRTWTGRSETQNRPRRVTVELDAMTGAIVKREDFSQRHWIDRAVGYGIAAHEGQLFGWLNVALGLLTTAGLVLLSVSAVVMWWRRREPGVLGAPSAGHGRATGGLLLSILVLGLCFPLFAASLAAVLLLEWAVLRRVPRASAWLGLT
ncbi:MAG: PepSY-associated TM helix domain-containing protein [Planctomycetota bacterium]